ncbi:hypothetical protein [Embleya sp. AB8]|uniref:hypothetical protein n=1 Tax=Embleya sp. AB8 TaxID=3156304 RepID=UPI003C7528C7
MSAIDPPAADAGRAETEDEFESGGNDGISLSGGPVTNTGAIVAGGDNRVTVRRTGSVRGARATGPGHPLTSTGALVSGSGHELEVEDTGDVVPGAPDPGAEPAPGRDPDPDVEPGRGPGGAGSPG